MHPPPPTNLILSHQSSLTRSTKGSFLPCLFLKSKFILVWRAIYALRKPMGRLPAVIIYCFLFSFLRTCVSLDSITQRESLRDGDTLVSAGGTFELGFFSPGMSKNRYLGVWYKDISPLTVVWVANRETPLNGSLGVVEVNDRGVLVLFNGTNSTVWSSNGSGKGESPIAQLLDSGNLVVKSGKGSNLGSLLWQSFDYPCDTLMPGMKLGWNLLTGLDRFLSSWKSTDDPSPGKFIIKIDPRGYPQIFQLEGSEIQTRPGSWNGIRFTGYPALKPNRIFTYEFVLNGKEVYYEYQLLNSSVLSRFSLTPLGIGQRFTWTTWTRNWELHSTGPVDQCENYGLCGAYTSCSVDNSPVCSCLKGFIPKNQEKWNSLDWSGGCVRRTPVKCNNEDGFLKYTNVKLPDTSSSWYDTTMSLEDCKRLCLQNCSCTAYTNLDIRGGGSGCLIWIADLIDMREFTEEGQDLYLRIAASEKDDFMDNGNSSKKKVKVALGSALSVMGLILLVLTIIVCKKKHGPVSGMTKILYRKNYKNKMRKENMDLPTLDLSTISKATDNFSSSNLLGEGGFGPVYKGVLGDGQEIAVKRLSKNSGQGPEEFRNEVMLIAKLQHRNLVKLLGCCIQHDEKLLIYEFMPNRSLNYFIFDQMRSKLLDWTKRFQIIGGIARGLLYLHQDSRLRIIHRDLKTSNILLDGNMNPKISDFGLAKTFYGDQDEDKTKRVMGTYGYMPPEYASRGSFSVKSDVFSFGVIVLEIVSGKKNREFCDPHHDLNLLGHAWRLWSEERPLQLMDEPLGDSVYSSQVLRCIHTALLCVQQRPEDRPDISSVVLMLNGEKLLPNPREPAFYPHQVDSSCKNCEMCSSNEISITLLEAR